MQSTKQKFVFDLVDFEQWVTDFFSFTNVPGLNGTLHYPSSIGTGYAKTKLIEPGLSYRILEYTLNQDLIVERKAGKDFQLLIYFYEYKDARNIQFKIGEKLFTSLHDTYHTIMMTTNLVGDELMLKKDNHLKGLTIQVDEAWLRKYIHPGFHKKLEALKTFTHLSGFLPANYRNSLQSVFKATDNSLFPNLFTTNRVLDLLEKFLTNVFHKDLENLDNVLSSEDFHTMMLIENELVVNYLEEFPGIAALAKKAMMSESKFKKLYKQAFGLGPYEYYQKNRMHKAKQMLYEGESISGVGNKLGYQNLSNFSSSFRKEFNFLPSELTRQKSRA